MATYREIAEDYAKKIRKAAKQTQLEKSASVGLIKVAFSRKDILLEVFKSIPPDLGRYTHTTTGNPLSEDEKKKILILTGKILKLSQPITIVHLVKGASNENAIELVTYISQFINELQEREE